MRDNQATVAIYVPPAAIEVLNRLVLRASVSDLEPPTKEQWTTIVDAWSVSRNQALTALTGLMRTYQPATRSDVVRTLIADGMPAYRDGMRIVLRGDRPTIALVLRITDASQSGELQTLLNQQHHASTQVTKVNDYMTKDENAQWLWLGRRALNRDTRMPDYLMAMARLRNEYGSLSGVAKQCLLIGLEMCQNGDSAEWNAWTAMTPEQRKLVSEALTVRA